MQYPAERRDSSVLYLGREGRLPAVLLWSLFPCKYLGPWGGRCNCRCFPVKGESEMRDSKAVKLCCVRAVRVMTAAAVKTRGSCLFHGGLIASWTRSTTIGRQPDPRDSVVQASAAPQCHAIGLNCPAPVHSPTYHQGHQ